MKATLHDELMREAGFENDYHRELARRRERRRRNLRRDVLRFVSIVAFVGALAVVGNIIVDTTHSASHVPQALLYGVPTAIFVGMLADLLVTRMTGEKRPVFARAAPAAVDRVWAWIARRREVEA